MFILSLFRILSNFSKQVLCETLSTQLSVSSGVNVKRPEQVEQKSDCESTPSLHSERAQSLEVGPRERDVKRERVGSEQQRGDHL